MQCKTHGSKSYLEGSPKDILPQDSAAINDLLSLCYEHDTNNMLLYSTNLPESFFDISSKVAGDFMQKMTNYRVRAAIVLSEDTKTSKLFGQMASDTNRLGSVRFFEDRDSAVEWLVKS